ncbi:response regulator [Alteromonas sediminis]|uniref:histidine kinase n=1 Tax=Alteromonas sediminis TaxID=2259342 RepID=A0A3N5YAM1_9ALTE|nr:ATP-binding protein [Alteromonas sediminis]RPJ68639.1 response regulator [Alteromonas sediminis]
MRLTSPHLIVGCLTAVIVYFLFRPFASPDAPFIWLSLNLLLVITSASHYGVYFFKKNLLDFTGWKISIFIMSLLWGGVWSLPIFIFTHDAPILYLCVMIILLIAMVSVPAPAMCHYPLAYFIYMSMPLMALGFKVKQLTIEGSELLLFMTPFLWGTLLIYGWDLYKTLLLSIGLQVEVQRAYKQSEQANLAKSKFIATASHDIRQPLQASIFLLEALKNYGNLNKNITKHITSLDKSMENMSNLLNALLDVSKLDANSMVSKSENISLQKFMHALKSDYHQLIIEKPMIEVQFDVEDCFAYVDGLLLRRVIENLFTNALKYTESGSVTIQVRQQNDRIFIAVTDTGVGIPSHCWDHIYDEFFQVENTQRDQSNGLGLGLSIVKKICVQQHWPLEFTTSLNRGSEFRVNVPAGKRTETLPVSDALPFNINLLRGKVVAVLENDEAIRQNLATLLAQWGCKSHCSGEFSQFRSSVITNGIKFDLLIIDNRLSGSMKGLDAIKILQSELNYTFETIMLTGDTATTDLITIENDGIFVLHKPIKPAMLRAAIMKKLRLQKI